MTRVWITVIALVAAPLGSQAERGARKKQAPGARIVTAPELEHATPTTAIIRFTANTAGGTVRHFGIVRFGRHPRNLDSTAMSPLRWTKASAPNVTYRVRIDGLAPETTYYYVVDAAQADGKAMGLKSPVSAFTTAALSQPAD